MKLQTVIWTIVLVLAGGYLAYRAQAHGMARVYVQEIGGEVSVVSAYEATTGTAQLSIARTVGVWVAAFLTLCILSFAYKDNPFYKLAESIVVGVSAAYWMVVAFWTTFIPNLLGKLFPAWIGAWAMPDLSPVRASFWFMYFIPLVLGAMLLWRLAPKGAWIARWPLAFIVGTTAGLRLVSFIQADFVSQTHNSIKSLYVVTDQAQAGSVGSALANIDFWATVSNWTILVGLACCLVYFFFSVEHKGVAGKLSRVGMGYLMITFGAAFGYTVMGRIALLAMRIEFLFDDWLWIIDPRNVRPSDWCGW